jgi:hypothetical protein
MITFDQNNIATPESQAFFEAKRLAIIQDKSTSDHAKAAQLTDLYNQYGLIYGTFTRRPATSVDVQPIDEYSYEPYAISGEWRWILFFIIFGLALLGLPYVDGWLAQNGIDFSIIKAIEQFFQWVFSGFS